MNGENRKFKFNLWRRGFGLFIGLLPLLLLVASIIYGIIHGPQPKFVALGWIIAAFMLTSINFFCSFIRPLFLRHVLRISEAKYKNVSGVPIIGSILIALGALFGFGAIGSSLLGVAAFVLDTGGSGWFLWATWKDSSFGILRVTTYA